MADNFSLQGSIQTSPASGSPSGVFALIASLDEQLTLVRKHQDEVLLDVEGPVSIAFGGVVNAHVVVLKVSAGPKVKARFTSTDGAVQAIPIDPFFLVITRGSNSPVVPITAIDLTRTPGFDTTVEIFLGEKS